MVKFFPYDLNMIIVDMDMFCWSDIVISMQIFGNSDMYAESGTRRVDSHSRHIQRVHIGVLRECLLNLVAHRICMGIGLSPLPHNLIR